jgi:predicted nucleic acid-binding protein
MKDAKIFLDTNILVYAYDTSAGEKQITAKERVKDGGASTILSEDLSDKQKIQRVLIENPFSAPSTKS